MRLSSERMEKEEGIDIHGTTAGKTQGRGKGLPPLRTMCAKHRPQKGNRGRGLDMRCSNEYTFKRLMIMDASPFLGWPICGSSAAHQAKSFKSASMVVTKTGAPDGPVAQADSVHSLSARHFRHTKHTESHMERRPGRSAARQERYLCAQTLCHRSARQQKPCIQQSEYIRSTFGVQSEYNRSTFGLW